jgi:hypothetical protein
MDYETATKRGPSTAGGLSGVSHDAGREGAIE